MWLSSVLGLFMILSVDLSVLYTHLEVHIPENSSRTILSPPPPKTTATPSPVLPTLYLSPCLLPRTPSHRLLPDSGTLVKPKSGLGSGVYTYDVGNVYLSFSHSVNSTSGSLGIQGTPTPQKLSSVPLTPPPHLYVLPPS